VSIDGDAIVVESREKKAEMFDALMKKLQPEGKYLSFERSEYNKAIKATAVVKIIPTEI